MSVVTVTLLSVLVGLALVGVAVLIVIAEHLADLKAYTMTQIEVLNKILKATVHQ